MSYEFCPACHKYREMTRHVCEPEWLVLHMLEAWAACARGDADPIGELAKLCERVRLLDRAALLIMRLEHQLEVG